jgi:hypothetical protein
MLFATEQGQAIHKTLDRPFGEMKRQNTGLAFSR